MPPLITGLLMAFLTGILYCVVGVFLSHVARRRIDMVAFNTVMFVAIAVLSVACCNWTALVRGNIPEAKHLAAIMVVAGFGNLAGLFLMTLSMRHGPQAASYTFAQCAMVWPFMAGLVFWGECGCMANYAGVALVMLSIVLFARKPGKGGEMSAGWFWLAICLGGFACNGITQTLCSMPSRWAGWADTARLRIPLLYVPTAVVLTGLSYKARRAIPKQMIGLGVLCAVAAMVSVQTVLASLDHMAMVQKASLVFPLATGVNVTLFACYSRFWLKEQFSASAWSGLACGVLGILLLGYGKT